MALPPLPEAVNTTDSPSHITALLASMDTVGVSSLERVSVTWDEVFAHTPLVTVISNMPLSPGFRLTVELYRASLVMVPAPLTLVHFTVPDGGFAPGNVRVALQLLTSVVVTSATAFGSMVVT